MEYVRRVSGRLYEERGLAGSGWSGQRVAEEEASLSNVKNLQADLGIIVLRSLGAAPRRLSERCRLEGAAHACG